jgi:hypothetical protein
MATERGRTRSGFGVGKSHTDLVKIILIRPPAHGIGIAPFYGVEPWFIRAPMMY